MNELHLLWIVFMRKLPFGMLDVCIYIFIYAFLYTAIEVQFAKISACAVGGSWLRFNVYFSKLFALQ